MVTDVNGDGKKDLAFVANTSAGTGAVLTMVGNGDGTFQAATVAVAGYRNNYTIAAGNFD